MVTTDQVHEQLQEPSRKASLRDAQRRLRRLLRELATGDKLRLVAATVVTLLGGGIAGLLPLLIGQLVTGALGERRAVLASSLGGLALVAVAMLLQQGLQVFRRQLIENVATGLERDMRIRTYAHLLKTDLDAIRHGRLGGLYGRVNRGIEGAVRLLKLGGLDLLPALAAAVAALIAAVSQSPAVAAVMAAVIPTGFTLVWLQVRSQAGIRVAIRDCKEDVDGQVVELLPALESVRAVAAHGYFVERIATACGRLRETEMRHHRAMSLFDAAKAANEVVWLAAVLVLALYTAPPSPSGAGMLVAALMLYWGVLTPLKELHRILDEATESASAASDLFDVLDTPLDTGFTTRVGLGEVGAPSTPVVEAVGLRFAHLHEAGPILHDVNFTVRSGERVGIVGISGCGKSTLLKLLRRFHHGYLGTIRLRGRNLMELDHGKLTALVGYVPQEPRVFRGTIYENIVLGRDVEPADVVVAATRAHIHADILSMPHGYETLVGERGDTISGGQRQRICLARALLRAPDLLLLDEPTSALDATSERAVQMAIDALEGVTMLIVAHRLSTLRATDRILVLDGGRIVDSGPFDELARREGVFRKLLLAQEAMIRVNPSAAAGLTPAVAGA